MLFTFCLTMSSITPSLFSFYFSLFYHLPVLPAGGPTAVGPVAVAEHDRRLLDAGGGVMHTPTPRPLDHEFSVHFQADGRHAFVQTDRGYVLAVVDEAPGAGEVVLRLSPQDAVQMGQQMIRVARRLADTV